MQYARVLLVAVSAALVARFWVGVAPVKATASWLAPVDWLALAETLAAAAAGQLLGRLVRLSAWPLLGPMLLLAALHLTGVLPHIELPRWLLALCYAMVGWNIGLGFRRESLLHAARTLPAILLTILGLMGFCAGLAWCLTRWAGVDLLTAYLATSPGGLDSVAIIASATHVDLPFVMSLQGVRLIFVIVLAPLLTKLVVRRSPHLQKETKSGM
jgi:membrane AbrB-like protein